MNNKGSFRFSIAVIAAAFCTGVALLAANVMLGDLNQDEGWYLYAARMVRAGSLPYRDFAYTQAPVLPFVYAIIDPLVSAHGLAAGRVFTAILALCAAGMAATLAGRLAQPGERATAAALALTLTLVNVYHSYFSAVVKTYALTSFFLLGGLLLLCTALERRSRTMTALSAVLLALAAGTRSSAAVILPLAFLFLCIDRKSRAMLGWLWFGLGGVTASALIILPLFLKAPESFWFCAVAYHAMRDSGGLLQSLIYKAGFLSRVLGAYFVAIGLWVVVLMARAFRIPDEATPREAGKQGLPMTVLLWAAVAAVSLVHFTAPFPYDDYQVFIFPVFAVAVAVSAARLARRAEGNATGRRAAAWLVAAVFLLSLASSVSSQVNQDWFVQGRDRIWWRLKDKTPLVKLREAGAMLRSMAGPDDLLLTQDPYLAVESGLALPRGLEMGQFCYFPEFSDDKAERLHVMNRARLSALIRDCGAPVAALSGYAFAIRSPQIEPLSEEEQAEFTSEIDARYEPVLDIPDFGQAFTTLRVFRKRK